jgi:hypothetical protein
MERSVEPAWPASDSTVALQALSLAEIAEVRAGRLPARLLQIVGSQATFRSWFFGIGFGMLAVGLLSLLVAAEASVYFDADSGPINVVVEVIVPALLGFVACAALSIGCFLRRSSVLRAIALASVVSVDGAIAKDFVEQGAFIKVRGLVFEVRDLALWNALVEGSGYRVYVTSKPATLVFIEPLG